MIFILWGRPDHLNVTQEDLYLWKMTHCNSQIIFCNYQNLINMTGTSLSQHEPIGLHACYAPWVQKQYTRNWALHLTRRNILQMEHYMTANAIRKSLQARAETCENYTSACYPALSGSESSDRRCLCSASITVFISLIFCLKTLVSSLHNKDPKLHCVGNRNKLYVKFAPEGSEVIGPAITPAFLTNSWRCRGLAQLSASPAESSDTLSVSSALESRAASKLEKRLSSKLASLPMWMSEELDLEKRTTTWGHLKREPWKTPAKAVPGQQPSLQEEHSGERELCGQTGDPCSTLHCKARSAGGICTMNSTCLQISIQYSLIAVAEDAYTYPSDVKEKMPCCQENSISYTVCEMPQSL